MCVADDPSGATVCTTMEMHHTVNRLLSLLSSGHLGHQGHISHIGHLGHLGHLGHQGLHFMKSTSHNSFVFNRRTTSGSTGLLRRQ